MGSILRSMSADSAEFKKITAAWMGTLALFLVHGLIVASWVSRIPAIQISLKLSNGVLGLTLLSPAVGALTTIPVTGWLVGRYGSKRVSTISGLLFATSLVLPGLAFNAWTLSAALYVWGAFAAAMDVSMNAQGVEVEKALGKPTMSRFHGMFSLGGMIGAGIGGVVADYGVRPALHFGVSGMVNAVAIGWIASLLLESREPAPGSGHRLPWSKTPRVLFALSAIGFCSLLAEGAIGDWTAVYLKQVFQAGPGMAAAGYAVFSASMAVFRFLGDIITTRLGPMRTVRTGSIVAAIGLLWAIVAQSSAMALPGFAATGAGFSVIIPLVFGGGGRVKGINPGAGIATVTGIGYIGFIVGPPAIGFAAQLSTLRYALLIVVGCCVISAVLAKFMRLLGAGAASSEAPELHF